ncbi:MAG: alpha/beta hydrolase [Armatimonadetes bacterium]|nr:alpha/beta hydrolase [Armatimonadota bacterium]
MTEKTVFESDQGLELAAAIDLPEGEPKGFALFSHCFTCTKDLPIAVHIGKALAAEGIALVRFDLPGLGKSQGDFAETTLSGNVADVVAVARQMEDRYGLPSVLIGHSFGGPTAILAAHEIPSVTAVATIAAPCSSKHVRHFFDGVEFDDAGIGEIDVAGRRFRINRAFDEDLDQHQMAEKIASLDRALIVFHSPTDTVVGIENASDIFGAARHPKSFVSLDRADHIVSDAPTARYLGHVLSAWAQYYL